MRRQVKCFAAPVTLNKIAVKSDIGKDKPLDTIDLEAPYLIFLGKETDLAYAKTGAGLAHWRPELCKGQLRLAGCTVDLGLPDMTLQQAADAGVRSLVVGTASVGGHISDAWIDTLEAAAWLGMDVVAGVHKRLYEVPRLVAAAEKTGARLVDVRVPPKSLPIGNGMKRTGNRLLTVGTDCAVGKKYTALALEKDMKQAGMNADFRASGQTGIMIAGKGLPIDAVVADFLSGAVELLSPDNTADHWDVIEGQGCLFHPGYGAVSMGLLIGSQPDAFVVCTQAGRSKIEGWKEFALPSVEAVIERTMAIGKQYNPLIRCVGVSVNTSSLPVEGAEVYLQALSARVGLPCVDPVRNGTGSIIERLNADFRFRGVA